MSGLNTVMITSINHSKSRDSFQDVCENLRRRRQALESQTRTTQKFYDDLTTNKKEHTPDEHQKTPNSWLMQSCLVSDDASMGTKPTQKLHVERSASFSRTEIPEARTPTMEINSRIAPPGSDRVSSLDRGSRKKMSKKRWSHSTKSNEIDPDQKNEEPKPSTCEEEKDSPSTTEKTENDKLLLSAGETTSRKSRAASYRRFRPLSRSRSRSRSGSRSQGRKTRQRSTSRDDHYKQTRQDESNGMGESTFLVLPIELIKNSSRLSWYKNSEGVDRDSRDEQSSRGDPKTIDREQTCVGVNLPPKPDIPVKKPALPEDIHIGTGSIKGTYSEDEAEERLVWQSPKRKGHIAELAKEVNLRAVHTMIVSESSPMRSEEQEPVYHSEQLKCGATSEFLKETKENVKASISNVAGESTEAPSSYQNDLRSCLRTNSRLQESQVETAERSAQTNGVEYSDNRVLPSTIPQEKRSAAVSRNHVRPKSQEDIRSVPASSGLTEKAQKHPHHFTKKQSHQQKKNTDNDDNEDNSHGRTTVKSSASKSVRTFLKEKRLFKGAKANHGKTSRSNRKTRENNGNDNDNESSILEPFNLLSDNEKMALRRIERYIMETQSLLERATSMMQEDTTGSEVDILTAKAFAYASEAEKVAATIRSASVWKGQQPCRGPTLTSSTSSCDDNSYSFVDRVDQEEYLRRLEGLSLADFGPSLICGNNKTGTIPFDETRSVGFETMQILATLNKNLRLTDQAAASIYKATSGTAQRSWLNYGHKTRGGFGLCAAPGFGHVKTNLNMEQLDGQVEDQFPISVLLPVHDSLAETAKNEAFSVLLEQQQQQQQQQQQRNSSWRMGQWCIKNAGSRHHSRKDESPGEQTKNVNFSDAAAIEVEPPSPQEPNIIYDIDGEYSFSDRHTYATDRTSVASTATFSVVYAMLGQVGDDCVDRLCCSAKRDF